MTIYPVPGQNPPSGRVGVYWKLPSGPWSILGGDHRGKLVGKADEIVLTDVSFVVSETSWRSGHDGTGKRGKKRNVVAWAVGTIASDIPELGNHPRRVTFRFFESGAVNERVGVFFDPATGEIVTSASVVVFDPKGHAWIPRERIEPCGI